MGEIAKLLSEDGGVLVHAIDSTDVVREMERLHKTSATASAALGRLLTGAALMGSMLKNEGDSVTLKVDGGGPVGSLLAISDAGCRVRGCCTNPLADLPLNAQNGKLNVGGIVGTEGNLTVIRNGAGKEQQIGQVALVSGEIAQDITAYFAHSEQIPTVCALGVLVDRDLSILNAGGFLLQLMPGATEEEISMVEENIRTLPAVTTLLAQGASAREIGAAALKGFSLRDLPSVHAAYCCNCSHDKMYRVLLSLGREELQRLAKEQALTEIVCSYCNKKYEFTSKQLLEMAEQGRK